MRDDASPSVRREVDKGISYIAAELRDTRRHRPQELADYAAIVVPLLTRDLEIEDLLTPAADAFVYLATTAASRCAIPSLINALRLDPDNEATCRALAAMAPESIWPVVDALQHEDQRIRTGAARALWFSTWAESPVDIVPVIADFAVAGGRQKRRLAIHALKTLGPAAKSALSALRQVALEDGELRGAAQDAIRSIEG
jgi:hypothetical protein